METTDPTGSDQLFVLVTDVMKKNPMIGQRFTAHVRAVTGHNNLGEYHNNGSTENDKVAMYTELLEAVDKNQLHLLKGSIARGQAVDVPQPEVPEAEPEPAPKKRVTVPKGNDDEDDGDALETLKALKKLFTPSTKVEVDEAMVIKIVAEKTAALEKSLRDKVDGFLKKLPPRDAIEIRRSETETTTVEGLYHWQLPQVITWVAANVPLWLWGGAGGGKTTMARQLGQALQLETWLISVDEQLTVGKLCGFNNLSVGEYVIGLLYKPYKNGGLVLLDEIDLNAAVIAALNSLIANDYYTFPNGETVKRHPNFRIIAGANTKGCGAVAGYVARVRLDAATLDRFAVIELKYDWDLTRACAKGTPKRHNPDNVWKQETHSEERCDQWIDWVEKVNKNVGTSVLVSPRASILGVRALRAGIPAEEVAEALVFKLVSEDTKKSIQNHCGRFE